MVLTPWAGRGTTAAAPPVRGEPGVQLKRPDVVGSPGRREDGRRQWAEEQHG